MRIFMPGLFLAYRNISLPCSYLCPNCLGFLGGFPETPYRPRRHCKSGTFGALVVMRIFMPGLFLAYRNISLPCPNLCPNWLAFLGGFPETYPRTRRHCESGTFGALVVMTIFMPGLFLSKKEYFSTMFLSCPNWLGFLGGFPETFPQPRRHCKSGTFGALVVMRIFMPGLFLAYSNISLPCSYLCPNCFGDV